MKLSNTGKVTNVNMHSDSASAHKINITTNVNINKMTDS